MEQGIAGLGIHIYADGADIDRLRTLTTHAQIAGFTTNPTLLRRAGVTDYETFSRDLIELVDGRPVSLEVLADETDEIIRQACCLASWGPNVFVKVPITTTDGSSLVPAIKQLAGDGVQLNVTAMLTIDQVREVVPALADGPPAFVSVFAGRIADTGRDPLPLMTEAVALVAPHHDLRLIWASPREVLNIFQADSIGCDVITLTDDLITKFSFIGKDLDQLSLETVRMFVKDAALSGYKL